jgi:hypothetical protein
MNGKQPMTCLVNLDWCDYRCPCGAWFSSRHRSLQDVTLWLQEHKPHTNALCHEHTTTDGCRVYSSPPPDEITPL